MGATCARRVAPAGGRRIAAAALDGRWDESLTQYRHCIGIYAEQGARAQHAMSINYGGRCYSARAGRLADSLRYAHEFREIASELGNAPLLACRAMEAEPHLYQGAWTDVIRVAEESLPIAWQIGETNVILFGSAWLGLACLKVGRLIEARRVIDHAIAHWQARRASTPFSLTYLPIAAPLTRLAGGPERPPSHRHAQPASAKIAST